jgi:hypothetical protein
VSLPIPGVRYAWDDPNKLWVAAGRESLSTLTNLFPARYTDANSPWQLQPGESLLDDMPAGATIVNANSYSSSTDIYTILQAVETTATGPVYVRFDAKTYYLSSFRNYGTNDWRGFTNANRRVMGLIGHASQTTVFQVSPSAISSSDGAVEYALNSTASTGPVPITTLYLSNSTVNTPLFISGITFRGTLQTPFSVYSSASQASFRKNHTVASPLPYRGIAIWAAIAGSRMQFCRFQGLGFTLNTAPPFETGALDINRDNGMVYYRNEVDGRIASEIDSSRPVAGGGIMLNKSTYSLVKDTWQHHTRRSGFATNTNTNNVNENYYVDNLQAERIADTNDSWAGDNGYFNGSNVEEVIGTFTYTNARFNVTSGAHINWAIPYSGPNGVYTAPDHAVIIVRGFRSDDTQYGGCLRIAVSQRPNSTGVSPVWTRLSEVGIQASGFFDIKDENGVALTPVRHNAWNSTMTADKYYVVTY